MPLVWGIAPWLRPQVSHMEPPLQDSRIANDSCRHQSPAQAKGWAKGMRRDETKFGQTWTISGDDAVWPTGSRLWGCFGTSNKTIQNMQSRSPPVNCAQSWRWKVHSPRKLIGEDMWERIKSSFPWGCWNFPVETPSSKSPNISC